jgi:hypothetical protein
MKANPKLNEILDLGPRANLSRSRCRIRAFIALRGPKLPKGVGTGGLVSASAAVAPTDPRV